MSCQLKAGWKLFLLCFISVSSECVAAPTHHRNDTIWSQFQKNDKQLTDPLALTGVGALPGHITMVGGTGCLAHPLTLVLTVVHAHHIAAIAMERSGGGGDQSEMDEAAGTHRYRNDDAVCLHRIYLFVRSSHLIRGCHVQPVGD